jgi:hypothetical protein
MRNIMRLLLLSILLLSFIDLAFSQRNNCIVSLSNQCVLDSVKLNSITNDSINLEYRGNPVIVALDSIRIIRYPGKSYIEAGMFFGSMLGFGLSGKIMKLFFDMDTLTPEKIGLTIIFPAVLVGGLGSLIGWLASEPEEVYDFSNLSYDEKNKLIYSVIGRENKK